MISERIAKYTCKIFKVAIEIYEYASPSQKIVDFRVRSLDRKLSSQSICKIYLIKVDSVYDQASRSPHGEIAA